MSEEANAESQRFDAARHMRKIRTRQGMQDYLDVKWRIAWIRAEYPAAQIITEQIESDEQHAHFRCVINLPNGAVATGHGSETVGDFGDFYEKAETKAIGRACATLGYGTDAASDFDDGEPLDGRAAAKDERSERKLNPEERQQVDAQHERNTAPPMRLPATRSARPTQEAEPDGQERVLATVFAKCAEKGVAGVSDDDNYMTIAEKVNKALFDAGKGIEVKTDQYGHATPERSSTRSWRCLRRSRHRYSAERLRSLLFAGWRMAWVRLDDQIFLHPKIVAAGKDATLLHLSALTYASSQLTDGFIASTSLRLVAATVNVSPRGAARLVESGIWETVEGGYMIHDYLDYNPSANKVRAEREDAKARMQRLRSGNVRPNIERTSPEVCPSPSPTPRERETPPTPSPGEPAAKPPRVVRSRGSRIPPDFTTTPELYAYAAEKGVTADEAESVTEGFVLYWQSASGRSATKMDWNKAWMNRVLDLLAAGKIGVVRRNGHQPYPLRPSQADINRGGQLNANGTPRWSE